jgi:hypothetical protein
VIRNHEPVFSQMILVLALTRIYFEMNLGKEQLYILHMIVL